MDTIVIKNILSDTQISRLFAAIKDEFNSRPIIKENMPNPKTDKNDAVIYVKDYGRIDIKCLSVPQDIIEKVSDIVRDYVDDSFTNLVFDFLMYSEYSKASGGNPELLPHFDTAYASTIILDYQLQSNISWDIIVESESFTLEDNSALLFDPLENIHYRPVKKFNDGDFLKVLFFRFSSTKPIKIKKDNDHERLSRIMKQYHHDKLDERHGLEGSND